MKAALHRIGLSELNALLVVAAPTPAPAQQYQAIVTPTCTVLTVLVLCILFSSVWLSPRAEAGVLQRVQTVYRDGNPLLPAGGVSFDFTPGVFDDFSEDEIFGVTSADIGTEILAQVNGNNSFGLYDAVASANRFGSLGLSTSILQEIGTEEFTGARVVIASDEFVNLSGIPQTAVANFLIDGGELFAPGTDTRAEYRLVVGAENLGNVPITTTKNDLEDLLPNINDDALFSNGPTFVSHGELVRDFLGNVSYTQVIDNFADVNDDLGAIFDEPNSLVEIPLSPQSFDLGIMAPGDRMFLYYAVYFQGTINFDGLASTEFSDPFNLSMDPKFPAIVFIPEPATGVLFGMGAVGLLGIRRARGCSVSLG